MEWIPVRWQVDRSEPWRDAGQALSIDRMVSPFYDGVRYAVRRGNNCLSRVTGEWVYEPLPSSRDDRFYQEYRFDSFDKAMVAAERAPR